MIGVIIVAGIAVDWWDAHQTKPLSKPAEVLAPNDVMVQRLVEENERLKTDNALLNMKNDALRKQIDELGQRPADAAPKADVVKEERPVGG